MLPDIDALNKKNSATAATITIPIILKIPTFLPNIFNLPYNIIIIKISR